MTSREEAIKFLELEKESTKMLWDSINYEGGIEYFEKSLEVLDMAIKALDQPRWIPVTEKLPEDDGYYMVTMKAPFYYKANTYGYITRVAYYISCVMQWHDAKGEVVAWMPLPEPYKVESEEKE